MNALSIRKLYLKSRRDWINRIRVIVIKDKKVNLSMKRIHKIRKSNMLKVKRKEYQDLYYVI